MHFQNIYILPPWKVFCFEPPLPPGNSSSFSYIASTNLAFKTPRLPRNFQLPLMGWVWIFSGTTYCRAILNTNFVLILLLVHETYLFFAQSTFAPRIFLPLYKFHLKRLLCSYHTNITVMKGLKCTIMYTHVTEELES